jgi:oligoribonuclease
VNDLLVWVDCEMTGLDLGRDALIEVAALVTDPELNVLGEGVDVVIHAEETLLGGMVEIVREMHDKSGLTDAVRASAVTVADAEDMVMTYVTSHVKESRTAPLCGNSIATDRGFLARDMPRFDAHLHYRMIDVSSVPPLVPPDVLRSAAQGPRPPRARRHSREHPGAGVLPAHGVRPPAGAGYRRGQGDRDRGRGGVPHTLTRSPPAGGVWLSWSSAFVAMVAVAQLVEHRVVVPGVVGSSPISHPIRWARWSGVRHLAVGEHVASP